MVRYDHRPALWLICAATTLSAAAAQDMRGLELMRDSTKGNCSICHLIPDIGLPEEAQGDIGPSLAGVGGRLTAQELRDRIADSRRLNPDTVMPAYGTTVGLVDVDPRYRGKPILTADEIDAIVTWLEAER